ncbi:MAG TPA: hypothetical protein PKV80_02550 [Leptospiraceae bacterium]|nr:hypothetical protein [Leptospiraceae bacterium]
MDEKNTQTLEQVLNSVPVARDIPVILTQAQYSAIQDLISTIAKNNRVGYISTTHRILVETLIAFYRANTKEDAPVLDNTVLLSFATTISILRGNIRTKHKAVLREVL